MKNWMLWFYIDWRFFHWHIRRAQYGDITFGREVKKQARAEKYWRLQLALRARGPMHAGYVWE